MNVSSSVDYNIAEIRKRFYYDKTVIIRKFKTSGSEGLTCSVIFICDIAKKENINDYIVKPVMGVSDKELSSGRKISEIFLDHIVAFSELEIAKNMEKIVAALVNGDTVLLMDDCDEAIITKTSDWKTRSVTEPGTEKVVRGPKEGFTESISMNIALLRKKLKTPELQFVYKELGTLSKTEVAICYIKKIASRKIVDELLNRLDKIDIDGIMDSGHIQEVIKDSPFSPFKTVGNTERPDVVAARLLEGRIAIICDGSPFVLTLPFIFMEYFQSNEDYYSDFYFGSVNRLLRWIAFFLTTSVPAIYVALVTFHQELLPTPLLLSIAAARQGVPLPTVFEAMGLLFIFEVLREAGVRMPAPIGQTISIVGALVIGQSAVEARLVSAPIIIVAALTGITSFLIYRMEGSLIVTRTVFLLLASFLGLYGYIFGVIGLFIHLMSLRSFGIPYMLNVGSLSFQDQKDMLIRVPWRYMYYRPKLIGGKNKKRIKSEDEKGA